MRNTRNRIAATHGFTLMEVMVTVAIVAILASVALPSYGNYVTRSKLQEATGNLANLRVQMEQYYGNGGTYVGGPCAPGASSEVKYFTYSCPSGQPTASTYRIQAVGGRAGGDTSMTGFTLTIDQANAKTTAAVPAGWTVPSGNCWIQKKDGHC